ncbi:lymphatic vessel endothelial hyaluronic acid receptor 1-like [Myxocyprinus asiaticus]|uniref:lymphatic vessel endothelial hyaluronic acid receptor 1-like n=1 Tax=Myxocyprinus asiaticus TaxID=70543 RepID=UPI002223CAAB|nr:lymphatic vessel endothelial hyaluronic acid receptor 1-like [Myxocyprinus asiaticus]
MARVWMLLLLNSLFMCYISVDIQLIKVYPKRAISGVFEASLRNKYSMTESEARDICEQLGVTIASKAQVVEAWKQGLETCRFGWIDEQVAVVPRVEVKSNCGNGRTGVVVWHADLSRKFDVFCFNSTDSEAQNQAFVTTDQGTTRKPISIHASVSPTQTGVHFWKTSLSKPSSPSSPHQTFSSSVSPEISCSPSLNQMDDEGKHLPMSGTPVSVGAALLITVIFAVLLSVFLTLYYFKMNRPHRTLCDAEQQKEYIETEVWEHCNKKDLQKSQEEDHEEVKKEEDIGNNNDSSAD